MPNKQYPELKCIGYNKNNCTNIVINKKRSLCSSCMSKYYYHKEMSLGTRMQRNAQKRQRYYNVYKDYGSTQAKQARKRASSFNITCFKRHGQKIDHTKLTEFILIHQNKPCKYCSSPSNHIDHINPISQGGHTTFDNLQMLCERCNRAKGASSEKEFSDWIKQLKLSV